MKLSKKNPETHLLLFDRTFFARFSLAIAIALLMPAVLVAQPKDATEISGIVEKLNAVPVYFLEQETGGSYTVDAGPDRPVVAPVFFYAGSAGSLRDDLLTKEPPIEASVTEAGLGEIYLTLQKSGESEVTYALIADPTQVDVARRITGDESFKEVPVFAVRQKEGGSFLTTRNSDGALLLPFFIESQRAFAAINIMVQKNEDMKGKLAVSAMPLKTVVSDMIDGRLETRAVLFIPPQ